MAVSSRRFRRFVSARTSSGRGIEIARGVRQRVQPVHTPNQQLERRLVRSEANAVRTPTRRTRAQSAESHAKLESFRAAYHRRVNPQLSMRRGGGTAYNRGAVNGGSTFASKEERELFEVLQNLKRALGRFR